MVSTHLRVYGGQAARVTGHTRPVSPFLTINKDTGNKMIRMILRLYLFTLRFVSCLVCLYCHCYLLRERMTKGSLERYLIIV